MKKIIIFILFLNLFSCSNKPKSVFICGDHECVNNAEAKQYFEENLSIEVKIIEVKKDSKFDLVQLNLKENKNKKQISIKKSEKTQKKIKKLSQKEIKQIKKDIKDKRKLEEAKLIKKNEKIKIKESGKILTNKEKSIDKEIINIESFEKKEFINDVCKILEKCNIEEISKYLIKQGNKKKFPDITIRQ